MRGGDALFPYDFGENLFCRLNVQGLSKRTSYSVTSPPRWVWSIVMSMSVCLSVCSNISKSTRSNFTKFSALVGCGRASVASWRRCDTLCTSGFVDDVMLSHSGACIASCVFLNCGESVTNETTACNSYQILLNDDDEQVQSWVACPGQSLLSTIVLCNGFY